MLSQLQTIVKKLSSASLRMEKTKNREPSSRRSAKGKTKSVKDKNTSSSTSRRHRKRRDADSNSDASAESSSSAESNLDEKEVATFYQVLGNSQSLLHSRSVSSLSSKSIQATRKPDSQALPLVPILPAGQAKSNNIEFRLSQTANVRKGLQMLGTDCKLLPGLKRSSAETVAALVDSLQSRRLGLGGVAGPNVRKEPQRPETNRKALGTSCNLSPSLRSSLAETATALVDDAQSWYPRPGGVAAVNVQLWTANFQGQLQTLGRGP
jgi:hypothetical protein